MLCLLFCSLFIPSASSSIFARPLGDPIPVESCLAADPAGERDRIWRVGSSVGYRQRRLPARHLMRLLNYRQAPIGSLLVATLKAAKYLYFHSS